MIPPVTIDYILNRWCLVMRQQERDRINLHTSRPTLGGFRHLNIRNLVGWHETLSLSLFHNVATISTLPTLEHVKFLPTSESMHDLVALDIIVSAWIPNIKAF
jgi:hypothetical protein